MSEVAIKVEGLSKRYLIGHEAKTQRDETLRDASARALRNTVRATRHMLQGGQLVHGDSIEDFWALRDVSFDIKPGEVVGFIGRNGAGKSTLLKILSRITEPTTGKVTINGRVASLLEVGTGFHPELTGRENIFLNGAILGMSRREINQKFDEIVDFSGVERFLDTPVKRYSSGMYVRLAFAVAAHLEPEILIVDEVLAVGDAQFQKKCLGKISEVAGGGRTVLFVSHNMAAIEHMCTRTAVLEAGQMVCFTDTNSAIERYLRPAQAGYEGLGGVRPDWASPWIKSVKAIDAQGAERDTFGLGESLAFEVSFSQPGDKVLASPVLGVVIHHSVHGTVGGVSTRMTAFSSGPHSAGTFKCTLNRLPLLQGVYTVDIWLGDGADNVDTVEGVVSFTVSEADIYRTGAVPYQNMGILFLEPRWELEGVPA